LRVERNAAVSEQDTEHEKEKIRVAMIASAVIDELSKRSS